MTRGLHSISFGMFNSSLLYFTSATSSPQDCMLLFHQLPAYFGGVVPTVDCILALSERTACGALDFCLLLASGRERVNATGRPPQQLCRAQCVAKELYNNNIRTTRCFGTKRTISKTPQKINVIGNRCVVLCMYMRVCDVRSDDVGVRTRISTS